MSKGCQYIHLRGFDFFFLLKLLCYFIALVSWSVLVTNLLSSKIFALKIGFIHSSSWVLVINHFIFKSCSIFSVPFAINVFIDDNISYLTCYEE